MNVNSARLQCYSLRLFDNWSERAKHGAFKNTVTARDRYGKGMMESLTSVVSQEQEVGTNGIPSSRKEDILFSFDDTNFSRSKRGIDQWLNSQGCHFASFRALTALSYCLGTSTVIVVVDLEYAVAFIWYGALVLGHIFVRLYSQLCFRRKSYFSKVSSYGS